MGFFQCSLPNSRLPTPDSRLPINFFCYMLKFIASFQKGETESPNLRICEQSFLGSH